MNIETGRKLHGVIITPSSFEDPDDTVNLAFVLNDTVESCIFHVKRCAFELATEDFIHRESNEFDLAADIKNARRRKEKHLNVGDWISWYYTNDEVVDFRREMKIHETRCTSKGHQFLLEVVKSPTSDVLFTSTFGYIPLSKEQARLILPNVAFYAWITITVDITSKGEELKLEFDHFESTDHKVQIRTLDTPWTENYKVDTRGLALSDSDEDFLIEKDPTAKILENNVYDLYGFYVSERSLYVKEYPDKKYLIPVMDPQLLIPGVTYRFDAFWCEHRQYFIVSKYAKMDDMDVLHTVEENGKILIVDVVNQYDKHPSIFHTLKLGIGLLDDPTGSLAHHHLSRYANSKCRVFFYEDTNGTIGRFRIEKVDPDKAKKIANNVKENKSLITRIRGIVISSDGRVYSKLNSCIPFLLPQSYYLPIGTHLIFNATIGEGNVYNIVEDSIEVRDKEDPVPYVIHNGRVIFKSLASSTSRASILPPIESNHFGIVDDPLQIVNTNRSHQNICIWVSESGMDESGKRRIAQLPFFIVALRDNEPIIQNEKFIDKKGRDISGWLADRNGVLKEMKGPEIESCNIPSSMNRFSIPQRRSIQSSSLVSTVSYKSCGCIHNDMNDMNDICEAKKILAFLMSDPSFAKKIKPDLCDEILGCIV